MPELPEVETVCRGLRKSVIGDTITGAVVLRKESIGFPEPERFVAGIAGKKIEAVERRGKYILITLSGGTGLIVHLKMSGRLLVVDADSPPERFLRVRLRLASGNDLRFEDMRVFGRVWFVPPGKTFENVVPTLAALGVEPLDGLSAEVLKAALTGKKQPIKSTLMDQRVIAGVGNIYADEALFRAGIHPLRAAGSLNVPELERLSKVIRDVLRTAIKYRGTTLRDYRDTEGVNGNYQNKSLVYGREGEKCRVCKGTIERVKIAGRSSHFCIACQPKRRVRSSQPR